VRTLEFEKKGRALLCRREEGGGREETQKRELSARYPVEFAVKSALYLDFKKEGGGPCVETLEVAGGGKEKEPKTGPASPQSPTRCKKKGHYVDCLKGEGQRFLLVKGEKGKKKKGKSRPCRTIRSIEAPFLQFLQESFCASVRRKGRGGEVTESNLRLVRKGARKKRAPAYLRAPEGGEGGKEREGNEEPHSPMFERKAHLNYNAKGKKTIKTRIRREKKRQ